MKNYRVILTSSAYQDLDNLFTYIELQASAEKAEKYLKRIEQFCTTFKTFPERGTRVPGRIKNVRIVGFERRVAIIFRVHTQEVHIHRILYGGRDLTSVLIYL